MPANTRKTKIWRYSNMMKNIIHLPQQHLPFPMARYDTKRHRQKESQKTNFHIASATNWRNRQPVHHGTRNTKLREVVFPRLAIRGSEWKESDTQIWLSHGYGWMEYHNMNQMQAEIGTEICRLLDFSPQNPRDITMTDQQFWEISRQLILIL